MPHIINWTTWISPASRAEHWHSVCWMGTLRQKPWEPGSLTSTLYADTTSFCKYTPMVSLGFISTYKNLMCIKTRWLHEPVILLLDRNSQEIHICRHKKTNIRIFYAMLFGTMSTKMETTETQINSKKDNKMWHNNAMEYYITDKRNKLYLTISMKKFWKYHRMEKSCRIYIAWSTCIHLEKHTKQHYI